MNQELPIAAYRTQIVEAVYSNRITIIKGETGCGKSTQVPQYLLEISSKVVVTQPRRTAARTVAARVAEEMGCALGTLVGFRTALDHRDSTETKILYCTDGLQLVRELMETTNHDVLIIDEVHEWNINIELLMAWVRHRLASGNHLRVVIMSATIQPDILMKFFPVSGTVIEIPGRTHEVVEWQSGKTLVGDVVKLLRGEHNVLVFHSGKAEIARTIRQLESRNVNADILPLYGGMTLEDQVPCFLQYDRPKCVVSTNVAQTSITIPDIDAVVDSGVERQMENVEGIDGLRLRPISLADREQRKGRAGRTKPGIYIDRCPIPVKDRLTFPKPEILRLSLDHVVLRLAVVGIRAEDLAFANQPLPEKFVEARQTLFKLGCLDSAGAITSIGRGVAKLPLSPRFSRMIVEASRRGVVNDVLTLVSIMLFEEITMPGAKLSGERPGSDAFLQLDAFDRARDIAEDNFEAAGIKGTIFRRVKETREYLGGYVSALTSSSCYSKSGHDVLMSICAGMIDCLYKKSLTGDYKSASGDFRDLPEESVVHDAEFILGLPTNIQVKTEFGPKMNRFLRMATAVTPADLQELAPHLVTVSSDANTQRDYWQTGKLLTTTHTFFTGILIGVETVVKEK